ncbi:MAG: DHH family phosphoesterase [Proteobacteria bacterium]|nr:DHH family phosphoesterase [Pseudomonadota bacterium]
MTPDVAQLKQHLLHSAHLLLCTHRAPDGDGIGTMLGLWHVLQQQQRAATMWSPEGVPAHLRFLPGTERVCTQLPAGQRFDAAIVIDTSDDALLPEGFADAPIDGPLVFIDHHMHHRSSRDALFVRRPAPAAGELMADLLSDMQWPLNAEAARCLYTALVSDTASFRYAITTPHTHRTAAALIAAGASPTETARHLYERIPLARARLLGVLLHTLSVDEPLRFAWMHCPAATLRELGLPNNALDGMVNVARALRGIDTAALFSETPDGIHVEIRSKTDGNLTQWLGDYAAKGTRFGLQFTLPQHTLASATAWIRERLAAHQRAAVDAAEKR